MLGSMFLNYLVYWFYLYVLMVLIPLFGYYLFIWLSHRFKFISGVTYFRDFLLVMFIVSMFFIYLNFSNSSRILESFIALLNHLKDLDVDVELLGYTGFSKSFLENLKFLRVETYSSIFQDTLVRTRNLILWLFVLFLFKMILAFILNIVWFIFFFMRFTFFWSFERGSWVDLFFDRIKKLLIGSLAIGSFREDPDESFSFSFLELSFILFIFNWSFIILTSDIFIICILFWRVIIFDPVISFLLFTWGFHILTGLFFVIWFLFFYLNIRKPFIAFFNSSFFLKIYKTKGAEVLVAMFLFFILFILCKFLCCNSSVLNFFLESARGFVFEFPYYLIVYNLFKDLFTISSSSLSFCIQFSLLTSLFTLGKSGDISKFCLVFILLILYVL